MAKPEFDIDFHRMSSTELDAFRATVENGLALIKAGNRHMAALGQLCIAFAALDERITALYQPLLKCSEVQAFCIADENISRRCAVAIKLLYLEPELGEWRDWVVALLKRVDGELGRLRNRYVHDSYDIDAITTVKVDRTARLQKSQSHQPPTVTYNTRQTVTVEELDKVSLKASTVSHALSTAKKVLNDWRQTGLLPPLDPQWLPASKPNARCSNYRCNPKTPEILPIPLQYEFD